MAICTYFTTTLSFVRTTQESKFKAISGTPKMTSSRESKTIPFCAASDIASQWVVEYRPSLQSKSTFAIRRLSQERQDTHGQWRQALEIFGIVEWAT